jgi:hypothetical protein
MFNYTSRPDISLDPAGRGPSYGIPGYSSGYGSYSGSGQEGSGQNWSQLMPDQNPPSLAFDYEKSMSAGKQQVGNAFLNYVTSDQVPQYQFGPNSTLQVQYSPGGSQEKQSQFAILLASEIAQKAEVNEALLGTFSSEIDKRQEMNQKMTDSLNKPQQVEVENPVKIYYGDEASLASTQTIRISPQESSPQAVSGTASQPAPAAAASPLPAADTAQAQRLLDDAKAREARFNEVIEARQKGEVIDPGFELTDYQKAQLSYVDKAAQAGPGQTAGPVQEIAPVKAADPEEAQRLAADMQARADKFKEVLEARQKGVVIDPGFELSEYQKAQLTQVDSLAQAQEQAPSQATVTGALNPKPTDAEDARRIYSDMQAREATFKTVLEARKKGIIVDPGFELSDYQKALLNNADMTLQNASTVKSTSTSSVNPYSTKSYFGWIDKL